MGEYIMESDELASMLKGQLNGATGIGSIDNDDPELHLTEKDIKWWRDSKLGLFIHWGLYALVGKGEWSYFNQKIPEDTYRKLACDEFKPELTGKEIAQEWIGMAKSAGAKYAVMVTRHHDGYSLWDSKHSWKNFTTMHLGPKEDYVRFFTEECHKQNIHTGLYYSPMDWRFPGYFDPIGLRDNALLMKEQAYKQIEELGTKYGKIDIMWYDGGWLSHKGSDAAAAWFWEPIKLNKMLRSYQPNIMVTPRSGYKGDFRCDEGPGEIQGGIIAEPWEKCMSLSSAWGYIPGDKYWPLDYIITMFVNVICRNGNLLLNVGPDPSGRIPGEAKEILYGIGRWLDRNSEAVYGTRAGLWEPVDKIYGTTMKEDTVYLHILDCEAFENEILPSINQKIKKISLLNGEVIDYTQDTAGIRIHIPESVKEEKCIDTIVKIYL